MRLRTRSTAHKPETVEGDHAPIRKNFRSALCGSALLLSSALANPVAAQPNVTVEYGALIVGGGQSFEVPIVVTFDGNDDASSFSMSACIDPGVVIPTGFVAANLGHAGSPPGFPQSDIYPEGWTCGIVWDIAGGIVPPGTNTVGWLLGDAPESPVPASTAIQLCTLGTPPVITTIAIQGQNYDPIVLPGSIILLPPFRRGDTNDDGVLNIADAITLWAMLSPTTNAPPVTCDDAADTNDDGQIDVADVVTILSFLFQGGSIPAPLEGCGADQTSDALDCADAGSC